MKAIGLSLALFAGLSFAGVNWDGTYVGKGQFKTNTGKTGNYDVSLTYKGNNMTTTYVYTDAKGVKNTVTISGTGSVDKNGFLSFGTGKSAGKGYCFEAWCHYEIPGAGVEETLVIKDKNAYRLGSKGNQSVVWQESMDKQ